MLLLEDGLERIARLGNVREVELRLEIVFVGGAALGRPLPSISAALPEMRLHLLRFFYADRTGVGFLFGYADLQENVKNSSALDLEFSRQIINSNLVYHPPSIFLPQTR